VSLNNYIFLQSRTRKSTRKHTLVRKRKIDEHYKRIHDKSNQDTEVKVAAYIDTQ